jgi:hypothetical protein
MFSAPHPPSDFQRNFLAVSNLLARSFLIPTSIFLASTAIHAATIAVDGSTCTLVDAVAAANSDSAVGGCAAGSGADTLQLGADVTLSLARGNVDAGAKAGVADIVSTITLQGNPAGTTRTIARNPAWNCTVADPDSFRLFTVVTGGALTLRDLTLSNGCVAPIAGEAKGGAILVDGGSLTLAHVSVQSNHVRPGVGSLAKGGGLAVLGNATVQIDGSRFSANQVLGADDSATFAQTGAIDGGALAVDDVGALVSIGTSVFFDNLILPGKAERGGLACGGAIALDNGTLSIRSSYLHDNKAQGGATSATTPGVGHGGALCQSGGSLTLIGSSLAGNQALGGLGNGQFGDGDGIGGGAAIMGGVHTRFDNVTISGNHAAGGAAITAGFGGGVSLEKSGVVLARVTIASNSVQGGTRTRAGGLWLTNDASVFQSLIADNSGGSDCSVPTPGISWSGGYNLIEQVAPCTPGATDLTGIDPQLQPLADNGCSASQALPSGGCAPTQAIGQSGSVVGAAFTLQPSPALDAAQCLEGPGLLDQRGVSRPQDIAGVGVGQTTCDIGAFEATDSDGDGVTDEFDQCQGNDASGDVDGDHFCANLDDNDTDPTIGQWLFANGFE